MALGLPISTNSYANDLTINNLQNILEDIDYNFSNYDFYTTGVSQNPTGTTTNTSLSASDSVSNIQASADEFGNIYQIVYTFNANLPDEGDQSAIRSRANPVFSPLVDDVSGVHQWVNNCIYGENYNESKYINNFLFMCTVGDNNIIFTANK